MRPVALALVLGWLVAPALADAPTASPRPEGRAAAAESDAAPRPRPNSAADLEATPVPTRPATRPRTEGAAPQVSRRAGLGTTLPQPRPAEVPVARAAAPAPSSAPVRPPSRPQGRPQGRRDETPIVALAQAPVSAPAAAVQALPAMTVPRPRARPARVERRAARLRSRAAAAAARAAAEPTSAPGARTEARPRQVAAAGTTARPRQRDGGFLGGLFQRSAQPLPPVRGSVCGNRAIRGEKIAPIQGRIRGCGVAEPVRIREVAGVRLSTPATVDCTTAQALHSWVENGAKPAIGKTGGGLAALQVAAHYVCRTRNNRPGARISEHGRGRAIDISAIVLENGQRITVLHGWRSPQNRTKMREMHRAACGPFGTVLGPNADRFHQDHFHFDTARYRSGPYCR